MKMMTIDRISLSLLETFRCGALSLIITFACRAFSSRKKHDSGGIDTITISTGDGEKKKMKKKKQKPPKIHLIQMPMRKHNKQEKGRSFPNGRQSWVIGDHFPTGHDVTREETDVTDYEQDVTAEEVTRNAKTMTRHMTDTEDDVTGEESATGVGNYRRGRGIMSDLWRMGENALDAVAEHALESENKDNGIRDKSDFEGDGLLHYFFCSTVLVGLSLRNVFRFAAGRT